jgi:carbon starvation protein
VASLLVVCLAGFLVATGSANTIWPVFGASNQLLASLTLLAITLYLMQKGCSIMVTFIPTVLMMIMSIWGLVQLVNKFIISNMVITVTSIFLIVMAVLMVILSFIVMYRNMKIRRFG